MPFAKPPAHALPPGYRLDNYQIKQILGSGGFGITYLADDLNTKRQVAIKEYFPADLASRNTDSSIHPRSEKSGQGFEWGLSRFIEEARILSKFSHPNIVRVINFFKLNNTGYLVMNYEKGQSLGQALKAGGTAEPEEVMTLLLPLLDSLETVHKMNLLHRDIKPGNIYLRDLDNTPVLLDFGSARYDIRRCSQPLTSIVSRGYAPYEQYADDANWQGPWTDIYALGAVLYRCVTGKIPVEAPQRAHAGKSDQPDPLQPVRELCYREYPPKLLEGIDWALQLYEKDRPQDINAWKNVIIDLEWYSNAARRGNEPALRWMRRLRKLAKRNDPEACFTLGRIYEHGYGVRVELPEALKWYRLAAKANHPAAHHKLGDFYVDGRGIENDPQRAAEYYRQAAGQGDEEARRKLEALVQVSKPVRRGIPLHYIILPILILVIIAIIFWLI